jgi:hypothetical protein
MRARFLFLSAAVTLALSIADGQSPTPIIVQAMPVSTPPVRAVAVAVTVQSEQTALKVLQEIKGANQEILAKQAATLQQLDEMEKAAEQIKIYSKRG